MRVSLKRKIIQDLKKKILSDLEKNVYVRLAPSKIAGVGVFAVRDIPRGTNPFKGWTRIKFNTAVDPKEVFDNPRIHDGVKEMVKDFYVTTEGKLYLPNCSLNDINSSFFLNHSKKPNLETRDGETFVAKRNIKAGEELTADYGTYAES